MYLLSLFVSIAGLILLAYIFIQLLRSLVELFFAFIISPYVGAMFVKDDGKLFIE
jgi:hypothetical protein